MTAVVEYEGQSVPLNAGESALDALLRAGVPIAHACRSGLCQSCIVQVDETQHDDYKALAGMAAQRGLNAEQVSRHRVLACQCQPSALLKLKAVSETSSQRFETRIRNLRWLNENVLEVSVARPQGYGFVPGQYTTLWRDDLGRCYSFTLPSSTDAQERDSVCFHVRHYADGAMSDWLAQAAKAGDALALSPAIGGCVYQSPADRSLLFLASGTGLAPVLALIDAAIAAGHHGPMALVIAGRTPADFYHHEMIADLQARHNQLSCTYVVQNANVDTAQSEAVPTTQRAGQNTQWLVSDVYAHVAERYAKLSGWDVYLCGKESFVRKLKRQCFLAGANMGDIRADSFTAAR